MTKQIILFLLVVLTYSSLAQLSDWQSLTNMNEISDIAIYESNIVVASNGGAYFYNPITGTVEEFRNTEGLKSVDLAAVEADNYGNIIFASSDGIIQVYNPSEQTWANIRFDGTNINDLTVSNDTLWLASNDGAAVFLYRNSEWEYNDFFINFPVVLSSIKTIELFNNQVWLATDIGLISAPSNFSDITLTDAQNWIVQTTANGLPNNNILSLEVFQNNLIVGTSNSMASINAGNELSIITGFSSSANVLFAHGNNLYIGNGAHHYIFNGQVITLNKSFNFPISSIAVDNDGNILFGIFSRGLRNDQDEKLVYIQGPVKNHVRFILKDNQSRIWASTGRYKLTPNEGYSVYDSDSWTGYDFIGSVWGSLGNTDFFYQDRFDNVWIGSWGGGVQVIKPKGEEEFFHTHSYSGTKIVSTADSIYNVNLDPISEDYRYFLDGAAIDLEDYAVVTAFKEDLRGNLWIANSHAANKKYIAVAPYKGNFVELDTSKWVRFGSNDGIDFSEKTVTALEVDIFGRIWIAILDNGVYRLDYQNTLSNKSDDYLLHLTEENSPLYNGTLSSKYITSLAAGTDGTMWIGTAGGLDSFDGNNIYNHPGDPGGPGDPVGGKNGPIFFESARINYVVVDDYNNKWIATNDGLTVLKAGKTGFEPGAWTSYNSEHSGLLDNLIHCISIDQNNSQVFLGTESGISIFKGSFAEVKNDYKKVMAGPNPFNITNNYTFVIKNLKANSTVKIFNINGRLIKKLTPESNLIEGGRALWDGRDANGFKVASGIYFYSAFTEDGKSFSGKVAVIKK